jgi:hypothetical protein
VTSSITFSITRAPLDANSETNTPRSALIQGTNGTETIPLSAIEKQLVVTNMSSELEKTSFRRGEEDVPMIMFNIQNGGGTELVNDVYVDSIFIGFTMPGSDTPLGRDAIIKMIESIRVVNYDGYLASQSGLGKPAEEIEFVNFTVTDTISEIIEIGFTKEDSIPQNKTDTLIILANLRTDATERAFNMQLLDVSAYDVNKDINIGLIQPDGSEFGMNKSSISSQKLVVIPRDPKDIFRNYPNPFGRTYETTSIVFFLEQSSDVTIRIFTLTGNLVWTYQASGVPFGYNEVAWDARNDRGKLVLNGVYLCQIQIASTGQTYMTKIAVIK